MRMILGCFAGSCAHPIGANNVRARRTTGRRVNIFRISCVTRSFEMAQMTHARSAVARPPLTLLDGMIELSGLIERCRYARRADKGTRSQQRLARRIGIEPVRVAAFDEFPIPTDISKRKPLVPENHRY